MENVRDALNLERVERVYREILDHGIMMVRCKCYESDTGPHKGHIATRVDVLNLKKGRGWQAPVCYQFETSVGNSDGKFSLSTNSKISMFFCENDIDLDHNVVKGLVEMLSKWQEWSKWGVRELRCSVSFTSGITLNDVPSSHFAILPSILSAYANLKAEFFAQEKILKETVGSRYRDDVDKVLNSLLWRYSAFAAQAQREQMKQLFGVN